MPDRVTYAVEQRLRLLDFLVARYGYVHREALCDYFGISVPQASLDFRAYQAMAPDNIKYNLKAKRYEKTEDFKRVYA